MEKKFSELPHFTSQELEKIIVETRLGKAPKSIPEKELKSKTLSKEQIQGLFEMNLSRPHTITILAHTNVKDGPQLYKEYLRNQQKEKLDSMAGSKKIEKIGKGIQSAANQIDQKLGRARID